MFIAVLFIIAQTWRQPRYPLVGKWIKKIVVYSDKEYYLVLKRNELSKLIPSMERHGGNKCILLSERRKPGKATYCVTSTLEKAKLWRQ